MFSRKQRESFMTLNLAMITQIWCPKQRQQRRKKNELDFITIKNFVQLLREWNNPQNGRKYLLVWGINMHNI